MEVAHVLHRRRRASRLPATNFVKAPYTGRSKREVADMSIGSAAASGGADEETLVLQAVKIHSYTYTLDDNLKPGEYAFVGSSSSVGGPAGSVSAVMFDFGVNN